MSSSKRGLSYQGLYSQKLTAGYPDTQIWLFWVSMLNFWGVSTPGGHNWTPAEERDFSEAMNWGGRLTMLSQVYVLKFCPFTATGMMPLSILNSFKNSWSLPRSENLWRQIFLSKTLDQILPNHHLVPHVFSELLWESWTCSNRNEVHKNYER